MLRLESWRPIFRLMDSIVACVFAVNYTIDPEQKISPHITTNGPKKRLYLSIFGKQQKRIKTNANK